MGKNLNKPYEVRGKFKREETCMYLWLIEVDVWQEPDNIVNQKWFK